MATPSTGNSGLLYIDTADADDSGTARVYTLVGGQRSATRTISLGNADATDKDSDQYEEHVVTNRSSTISCEGLVEEGDVGQAKVISIIEGRRIQYWKFVTPGGTEYEFRGSSESWEESYPQDDVVDFSFSVKVTGSWAEL